MSFNYYFNQTLVNRKTIFTSPNCSMLVAVNNNRFRVSVENSSLITQHNINTN